jgi:hypothetical protein
MKLACLLVLTLLLPSTEGPARARLGTARTAAPRPVPHPSFVARYAAGSRAWARPDSLSARLRAVRTRYAGVRPSTPLSQQREQRRVEDLRPFSDETLGSVGRRATLGERGFAARDDRRLGSEARRQLLSRPPSAHARPRRR